MASSYVRQIPVVVEVLQQLWWNDPTRTRMLDVGKGLGKYGFLAHEFVGLDFNKAPDPSKMLREQSRWAIDAVEIQPNYMWPHIDHIYGTVHQGDITQIYRELPRYDVVLMTDVVEHIDATPATEVMRHWLGQGSAVVVTSPIKFFQQDAFESEWEHHRSHWRPRDFAFAPWMEWETAGPGRVYVLAPGPESFPIFGSRPYRRARRLARGVIDAFR